MGSSSYSDGLYKSRAAATGTGASFFTHTKDVNSGRAAASVHEKLDPSKPNKAGDRIREALDSAEHPDSVPIAVLFDVTGSMGVVPKVITAKLPQLMAILLKKGYVTDPQILFGGIGDATCDRAPLQLGQFESGNELDEALSLIYLEGGGGGQATESYELALYYMARHVKLDSFDKRDKKGYLFIIGDERPYLEVNPTEVKAAIGDDLTEAIQTTAIVEEVKEKFEVFWIMPDGTTHFRDEAVVDPLAKLFGERFLKLQDPADVCETIAMTIGHCEGRSVDDVAKDLADVGASASSIRSASTALANFKGGGSALAKRAATVEGALPASAPVDDVGRL